LNESLPSPQTQGSDTPDSVEDTRLPTDHIQASQCSSEHLSSEPPQNDPISVGSQCSSERFSCEYPLDDSANISPQCSSLDGGIDPPYKDTSIKGRKVFGISHHFII
jgi:exonuclease-1